MIGSIGLGFVPVLAAFALAQAPIAGVVVDAQGRPVPGAEVVLSTGLTREGKVPILAENRTDSSGHFSFARQEIRREEEDGSIGTIWVLKPAFGLGIIDLLRHDQPQQVHRVVLDTARVRAITLMDAGGKPVAGARVAPRLVETESSPYDGVFIPDAWLDRLAATTDSRGVAPLPFLARVLDLRTVTVTRPGIGRQVLPLPYSKSREDATLTLGAPTQLTGRICIDGGAVPENAAIAVWSRCEIPSSTSRNLLRLPEPVSFATGPIRPRWDGTFETPNVLLRGTTYRVVVQREGFAPALSDWVKLEGTPGISVSVTLRPLANIEGRVIDRQGQPVAGALVVQPGGGPHTVTDSAGHFVLERARPGPSFLIVRKQGFRIRGRAIDSNDRTHFEMILTRSSEPAEPRMATQPELIPKEESRALARRLLDPVLKETQGRGDDAAKLWLLRILRRIDPPGLLEQIEKTKFTRPTTADYLKGQAALGLVAGDREEAAAVAESIADPAYKAGTLVDLVDALPPSELARKQALLDRAAMQARAAGLGSNKLFQMGEVAERWLELGEMDKALALFAEGRTLVEALPPAKRTDAGSFLAHLARVDPRAPLELIKGVGPDRWNQRTLANIAIRLALEHPAEAEQALHLLHEPLWPQIAGLRVCRRLAGKDPNRARRIAAGFPSARDRAYALTFLADGLAGTDPAAARAALDQAIHELDSAPANVPSESVEPSASASILPLCERIAPDRVDEVFWRAVAEQPPGDDPRADFGRDHALIDDSLLLSRYDRRVAATLFTPVAAFARSTSLRRASDLTPSTVLALGCIDPRAAVAVIERLPNPQSPDINDPTNWAIQTLAGHLAMPPDQRWQGIWRFHSGCGIAMFENVYRDL